MEILVFQHARVEHPGSLRALFAADGHRLHTVELDEGEPIPADLRAYDMLLVMGGPQDTWQEVEYPWLVSEKIAIRSFVQDLGRPYLGLCLGHQLLADALGGTVGPAATPEIGVMTVAPTPAGASDPVLDGLPSPLPVLQWHGAEVQRVPSGATILMSSPACQVQALRCGPWAFGFQFHVEVEADTVAAWAGLQGYAAALQRTLGEGAVDRLSHEVSARLPEFGAAADQLYRNIMRATLA